MIDKIYRMMGLRLVGLVVLVGLGGLAACQTAAVTPEGQAPGVSTPAPVTPAVRPTTPLPTNPPPTALPPTNPPPTALPTLPPPTATPTLPPPTPTPTPTPVPSLRRLTEGGCCVNPAWLPDSRRLVFIDRPPDGPVGLYAVDTEEAGPPTFFAERLGYYAAGYSLLWQPVGETIRVQRLSDGQTFTLRNGGRTINVSPDGRRVAWQVTPTQEGVPIEQRLSQIWVADIDGQNARQVASLLRASLTGWFPDGGRLLLSGRPDPKSQAIALSVLNLADGGLTELTRVERLRSGTVSPDGGWVLYSVAFHPDKAQNGLWIARSDGSERRRLDFYGAAQWRAEGKLVYIPLDADAPWHTLWEYDAATGRSSTLTDPATLPFKVSNGDWTVSPDGRKVVFVAAQDGNLWVIDLPAP